jgi:hypothetical protein
VTRVDLDAAEARAKAAAAEGYGGEWCWDGGTLVDEDHDEAVGISRDRAAPTSAGAHIAGMDPPTTLALAAELRAARTFRDDIAAALAPGRWRGFDGPDGVSKDEVLADVADALFRYDEAVGP